MRLWKGIVCGFVLLGFSTATLAAVGTASGYNDGNLEHTLREALSRNPALESVEPSVLHGVVTLTGEVSHYQDKLDAEAIARQVPGVHAVQSRITLNAPVVEDGELEDRVEDRLRFARADIGLTFPKIQVEAHRGIVSLTGSVKDPIEHAAAMALVGNTDGVLSIKDELSIDPALLTEDATRVRINKAVYRAVRASGEVGIGGVLPVHAVITDGTVTLMGAVSDAKAKEDLLSRVRETNGILSVDDEITVRNSTPAVMHETASSHVLTPCVQNKEVASASR